MTHEEPQDPCFSLQSQCGICTCGKLRRNRVWSDGHMEDGRHDEHLERSTVGPHIRPYDLSRCPRQASVVYPNTHRARLWQSF